MDRWPQECERQELSPTTIRTYRAQVEQTIRPRLGKVVLAKLTAKHLDDPYGSMKNRGVSPKTIRNQHAIISSALHQAVRWDWVRDNIADRAKLPRVSPHRISAPSVDDVRAVIEAAEERDPRLAPLLMLAALTGMRRGELCALHWTDIDLDRRELGVHRSIVVIPGGVKEKTTKTDRSRRVALDDVALALLIRHRVNVDQWATLAEVAVAEDPYVFSHAVDGSKPFRPDNVTGLFTRVCDSLDLRQVRLHDLRHFTATQLIGAGVDVHTVAGRLGHLGDTACPLPRDRRARTFRSGHRGSCAGTRTDTSRIGIGMTDPIEVTVVAPERWALHIDQLAALLRTSNAPRVIPDPIGKPANPSNLAVITCPSEWAGDIIALRGALVFSDGATPPPDQGAVSGAVAPVGDRLVYSVEEAATLLAISRSFAYEGVARGDSPSMRIGKRILVPKAALKRWLAKQPATDGGPSHARDSMI